MAFPAVAGYGQFPYGNFSPTLFSQNVIKAFRKMSVVQDITNTDYAGEIKDYGDTVKIIKEPDVIVQDYVRGKAVNPTELLDDGLTLTVDQGKAFAFQVDDIEAKQSHINWMALTSDRAMYKLRDNFDSNVLSYIAGAAGITTGLGTTTTPVGVTLGTPTSSQFTPLGLLNRMKRYFDVNNVPFEDRAVVVDPVFLEKLGDENSKLIPVNVTGDTQSVLRNGRVTEGKIRGFDVYMSNNLPVGGTGPDATSGANYGTVIAVHKSAVATASQIAKMEVLRSQTSFADICRGLLVFGRLALRPEAIAVARYQSA